MNHDFLRLQSWEQAAEAESRRLCRPAFRRDGDIETAMQQAQNLLRADISDRVNHCSSLDWLLYLRTPSVRHLLAWLNDGFETEHHAEFFTSQSIKASTDSKRQGRGIKPVLDDHRFRRIAQLIGASFVWTQLHVLRSLNAMDVTIGIDDSTDFPQKFPTNDQMEALRVCNSRIVSKPMLLVSGGAIAATTGETDTEATTFISVGIADGGFQAGPLGLAKVRQIFDLGILKPEFLQAIGDLLLALKVGYLAARNSGSRDKLERFGMICIESTAIAPLMEGAQGLIDSLRELLPDWSYGDTKSFQRRLHDSGVEFEFAPPMRTANGRSALDLFAASSLLDHVLFRSIEKRKQERGPLFEDEVQAMIERTPWQPLPAIKCWRGRTVKVAGKAITDIDAVGCHDGRLLLVECKSIYYGLAHGTAAQGEIRSAREKVEEAVRKYSLDEIRKADNIDVRDFSEIVRIVCTPVPVYVAAEYATPNTNGFPNSTSYWELYYLLSKVSR